MKAARDRAKGELGLKKNPKNQQQNDGCKLTTRRVTDSHPDRLSQMPVARCVCAREFNNYYK